MVNNKKVEFIHVSLDQDEESALEWAKNENFPWLHVLSRNIKKSKLSQYHTSRSVPFYVLIDKDGTPLAQGFSSTFAKAKELNE